MAKLKQKFSLSVEKSNYGVPYISKVSVEETAKTIYNNVLDGELSATSVAELFKFTSEVEKKLKEQTDENDSNTFTELVLNEISLNLNEGNSFSTKNGTKFSTLETAIKYDYSKCNDPILEKLYIQQEEIKKAIKDRESFLKTVKDSMLISVTDQETGELIENIEVYPPSKSSTTTYKTELLKG